jgi:glycerol kinase
LAVRAAFAAGRLAWGPLASFLAFRLLAERPHLVDSVNAARTLLWNLRSRCWDEDLTALFGIEPGPLPDCVPNFHEYGTLSVGGCRVPLRLVTGDQAAALFAFGRPRPEVPVLNIGTGAFLQRITGDSPRFVDGLLTGIVLDDGRTAHYALEGTINGAGAALDWAAACLPVGIPERTVPVYLERPIDPPLFLNGVAGLGAPWWVPDFPSIFIGGGDRAARMVAVVESIVFLARVNLDCMDGTGEPLRALCVTGGLSVLDGLCRRLATLCDLPVLRPPDHEATVRGLAALLAGLPPGWRRLGPADRFQPDPDDGGLGSRYRSWRRRMEREVEARR